MIDIEQILNGLKEVLVSSKKEKILGIATTADRTNPPFALGSLRETSTTISGSIILRDETLLNQIIKKFDGAVDYFFIDSEVKNELKDLEKSVVPKIKKSNVLIYKPNDFAVESLDMFIALLFGSLQNKKILVVGTGNIGSKIALKLCERGGSVFLYDIHIEKAKKIAEGLSLIKKGQTNISSVEDPVLSAKDCDLIVGCTPGIPAITDVMIETMHEGGKVIDAGNRTVTPEALLLAKQKGIEVLSLPTLGGYKGMIENWLFQRDLLQRKRQRSFDGYSFIVHGVLGTTGDVLVDNVDTPTLVFGVCDGAGGLLPKEEGRRIIQEYVARGGETSTIGIIETLYQ